MPVRLEPSAPKRLSDADLRPRGPVFPSPTDWRDQVLYFLLPDRFSDGRENRRPAFDRSDPDRHRVETLDRWREAGVRFQGGTIRGIASKLDYLKDLGVTALWIGPVWKQRADLETYHGYGIQNFLEIDPRFGTRQDLRDLVDAAHHRGMLVLLDAIFNHTGNNWFYRDEGEVQTMMPYRYAPPYPFGGWRSATGDPIAQIASPDDGVWPQELQDPEVYTRAGRIERWDPEPWEDPLHPQTEFRRGDFFDLKDLNLERGDVLSDVIRAYQYWIALLDIDGYRIDTVKHVSWEASRNFCGAIHEYAESIGKHNFWLLGEVTGGGAMARNYLEIFGRNIDAALDIGAPAEALARMVKGLGDPDAFFAQFGGHDILGSHRETGRYHVSILDDHDMVGRAKRRFAADSPLPRPDRYHQVAHAVGTQLTTLGVPCLYYGTEQALAGAGDDDRYLREALFGAEFGAFATSGCHVFDIDHPTYRRIALLARIRNRDDAVGMTLRRGRQYPRTTSFLDRPFALPGAGELIAWSRVLHHQEVLVALNTHGLEARGAEVTVDADLHPVGSTMTFVYRGDWNDFELAHPPLDETVVVVDRNGRHVVRLDLPPAGMVILV